MYQKIASADTLKVFMAEESKHIETSSNLGEPYGILSPILGANCLRILCLRTAIGSDGLSSGNKDDFTPMISDRVTILLLNPPKFSI